MYPARTVRFSRGQPGFSGGSPELYAETPGGVVVDEWNLFVGTYDGATIKLYANGVLLDETADPSGAAWATGSIVRVGYGVVTVTTSTQGSWFYGTVDEAAIWTRGITAEEVATLYAGGTGSPGPDAVGDGTIFNRHINTAADIDPTKLQHPGGTTSFLRADGTWATPTGGGGDPADDTSVWMPLTSTVGSDDVLVFDAGHSLIPTLTPI